MTDYAMPMMKDVREGALDLGTAGEFTRAEVQRSATWYQKNLNLVVRDEQQTVLYSKTISAPNNDRLSVWDISKSTLLGREGQQLHVYYEVDGVKSQVLTFTVKANFAAPLAVDLSGRNYIVFFNAALEPSPPPVVPDYAQFTRTTAQAVNYKSSDTNVARVDSGGKVSLLGNAEDPPVTITALDAAGASIGSYTLTVRGVRELYLLSDHPELQAEGATAAANTVGLSVPTADDFSRFGTVYAAAKDDLAGYLKQQNQGLPDMTARGFLGATDRNGSPAYLDLATLQVSSASPSQKGYAVGISQAD
ncbi:MULTISPECIES: hypothetical protein [unclassified Pseudomonas]|uniref:hypothetical protein n=1 Tax=unclassified Pseudomonas TaxID=196821 RepID=UPI001179C214|nr:hypothetical protein [Pseudomonas sp. 1239]